MVYVCCTLNPYVLERLKQHDDGHDHVLVFLLASTCTSKGKTMYVMTQLMCQYLNKPNPLIHALLMVEDGGIWVPINIHKLYWKG